MLNVKRVCSALFSLRLIVVALAVIVLLVKSQVTYLQLADQYIFLLADGLSSPEKNISFWPFLFQDQDVFNSQLTNLGLVSPDYFYWLEILLISMSASFLVIILPKLNNSTGVFLVFFIVLTLVISQLLFQVFKQQWLPFGTTIQFLILGYTVMLFWLKPNKKIQQLDSDLQETKIRLAQLLAQQGQLEDAYKLLATCSMEGNAIDATYDVALQQERKRQYHQAITSYKHIVSSKSRYKDAEKRLKALEKFEQCENSLSGTSDIASTLLIPSQKVSKPVLGRYEINKELGRGAMGVVYLGHDPKISRTVAIKTLNYSQFDGELLDELKQRFFREAEAAGRLSHPSIVTVYDVGEEPDLAFIAMDYAEGKPLSAYSKPSALLSIEKVHEVMLSVAEALEYAHQQNIVHRDIKPGNIIYNPTNGSLKVTDFGIAKIIDESKTKTGSVIGSPLYMSPEQLMGKQVSGSSDVYSLGVTFYQLLTGHTPFDGDSIATLTYQIINNKHKSLKSLRDDIPPSTTRIINKTLQKDPEKRFLSAGAMAVALRKVIEKEYGREVVI